MGVVVLILVAPVGGFDLLADPLGWLLVLLGIRSLPSGLPLRELVLALTGLALLVSVPLWTPAVVSAVAEADESLAWAVDLPRFAALGVLSLALARAAGAARDAGAQLWWRLVVVGFVVVTALPVLVFGGGLTGLDDVAGVAVAVVPLLVVVLGFAHSARGWAGGPAADPDAPRPPAGSSRGGR